MRTAGFRYLTSVMLLLAIVQGAAFAQGEINRVVKNGVVYEYDNSDWKCTGYDRSDPNFPPDGVITILSDIEVEMPGFDEPVSITITEIAASAFNDESHPVDNKDIRGVIISEGIEVIGQDAFNRCVNITNITLPTTIKKVGTGAFHCGDGLRWVDCRLVNSTWNKQLGYDDEVMYYGLANYLMNLEFTLIYMPSWWKTAGRNIVIAGDATGGNLSCQDFYFSRNMDYCVPFGFTAGKVTVKEMLRADADGAYSVCLPYSLPVPQGAKAYSLKRKAENDVFFGLVTGDMEACKPYLIMAPDMDIALDCKDERVLPTTVDAVAQSTTASTVTIHGTLQRISTANAAENDYYVLQANNEWKLVSGSSTVTVPPYRAYLTLDNTQSASINIGFSDETDGISSPESTFPTDSSPDDWWTLDGRKLDGPPAVKGIYINGARKVVVRE